ncbi:nuclear factor erythroid 2-related factor 2a [Hippoglossus hippoglossus]|uniref:nuclear factor erythroid 2-related factor 2a n=1 Tax=Hippoglossus hippoglossus TaxID=8267 RepID=UPI00148BD913|nr:nuclear factor erythroid 2-related factor 2a [Hippoglossus hippoglossus]
MMLEMEVMHPSQQDMDLIDILWKQDIDLGARREVFDYNYRQKEHELQRQRELEEEKRLHLLREQEKALLAQLQLDEETGEYIPRPLPPGTPLQSAVTPLEVTQNVSFTEENGDAMSFDECLQLLAETFPVEEAEDTSVCLDTAAVSVPSSRSSVMMSPEQPPLPPATLSPGPIPAPPPPQRMSLDLEQAWMELLSLPELQQCLNMQMEDTLETTTYSLPNSPEVQNPNFTFYPMTNLAEGETNSLNACPAEFINTFDGPVPTVAPPDSLSQIEVKAPELNTNFGAESFSDIFYPNPILEESSSQQGLEGNESSTMSDIPNKPSFTPMDLYSLSPGDAFDRGKQNLLAEMPDSDSGISSNTSPNASSPAKSAFGDGSYDYSDSDMEEMDHNPGSAESDYSEMLSLNFQPDDLQTVISLSAPIGQPHLRHEKKPKLYKTNLAEESGHNNVPFTKDKQRMYSDVRLPRDEQRAKALKIPMSVSMIINMPVDDFNEMMSKHPMNDAQLALVRDIRRRGKNKVAAQNCRKRKMENIVGLEGELDSLKDEKERLLSEKSQNITNLKEMKQQVNSLYLEVFSMLRDEKGNPYSPSEYSLQQSTDGSVFLVPRVKKTLIKGEDNYLSPM